MITDIEYRRGKAMIYFDGIRKITTRQIDVKACGIKSGTEMEVEEVLDLLASKQWNACYEAALTILDSCAQTRSSIISKLKMKGFVAAVAEAVAEKLKENRLIDEERYSERLVEYQMNRPVSRANVRRKLIAKGIDSDTIEDTLSVMDESQQIDACKKAIVPLFRRYRELEPREAKRKISQALARKGFSWDICSQVLEHYNIEED